MGLLSRIARGMGRLGLARGAVVSDASAQRLAHLMDSLDDVVMLSDQARRIVEVNRRAETQYGYTVSELLGMDILELRSPEARADFEATRAAYESQAKLVFQTVHRRKDGTTFPVEVSSRWVQVGGQRLSLGIIRDITERRRAEDELRRSEERLRYAMASATDGLWDFHLGRGEFYASARYAEMLGYRPEELPCDGDHWQKLVHPEDWPRLNSTLADYLSGKLAVYRCEYRMRTPDGDWRWMLARGKIVERDAKGTALRLVGTHSDVTERRRAEAALVTSERSYREIFNATSEAIFVHDSRSGAVVDVNEPMLRMYGYTTKTEVFKRSASEFSSGESPYTEAEAHRHVERASQVGTHVFEWHARKKSGALFWVEVSLQATHIGGEDRVLAVVRDISERKKAETERARLIAILERTPDFVGTADPQGRVTYINAALRRLTGLGEEQVKAGLRYADVHPAWVLSGVLEPGLAAARREGLWVGETALRAANGEELPVSQVIMAHKDARGEVTHFSTIMRDLSERKRFEQVLRQSEERLRTLIEHSNQLHYSHAPDHVLTYVSPQSRSFFDCEPEEARIRWTEFITDHPANTEGFRRTEEALRTGQRQPPYELELRTLKGRKIWVEVDESPVVLRGKTVAIVGALTDITARKHSELIVQRLSQLGRDLGAAAEPAQAARAVADAAHDLLGWDACFLKVRTPDLQRAYYTLRLDLVDGRRVEFPADSGDEITPVEQRVMNEGGLLILREPGSADQFVPFGNTSRASASLLYVPLRHQGRYLGVLTIQSYHHDAYDRAALDLLQTLADHAVGALERIRAERASRASEERFRTLVETSSEWVWEVDARGVFTYTSPRVRDLLGYEPEEVVGRPVFEFVPAEEAERIANLLLGVASDPKPFYGFQNVNRHKDGRLVIVETNAVPILDANGKLLGYRGFDRDITERTKAEQALAEREQHYRTLFDLSPVGILLEDADGTILETNAAMGRILGYTREELVGSNVRSLIPPDRLASAEQNIAAILSGQTLAHETTSLAKDRSLRRVELRETSVPLPHGGKGILVLVQDITKRLRAETALRATEQRLSRMIANLPAGFAYRCANDQDWTMHFITAGVAVLTGYPPEDFTSGRQTFASLIHPEDRQRVAREIEAALAARSPYQLEYRLKLADGAERWLWEQGAGVFGDNAEVEGLEGLVVDITARKQAEAATRELSGRLLAAQDEERRRLARELHDTTAQTIAALCMNLNMLSSKVPAGDAAAAQLLTDAVALGERAAQEIRTVAYLLHPPILEHIGLAGAIREFATGFSRRSGIAVTVEILPGVGRYAPDVELALLRIVQESLGNVHRHSGSPTAIIRLSQTAGEVLLDVADVGRGLSASRSPGETGVLSGVGIAGMRERLRHLGGRLEINSSPTGTIIRAILPLPTASRGEVTET